MKYSDIPQFTRQSAYRIDVAWAYLEDQLEQFSHGHRGYVFDMDPDFQRAHVWDEGKQRRYVEYGLRGGISSRDIYWNCPGWMRDFRGPMQLVDGKQRLEAVRKFMRGELAIFGGHRITDFVGHPPMEARFVFHVNNLNARAEVLRWYLGLNEGGVVHTTEELARVHALLDAEQMPSP